jgi:small subunit ribosomal protein S6
VYLKYVGGGGLVAEVERNLKLQEGVMKFMTVLSSEDVDMAALQIDPEETKLGKLELPPEEADKEDSREKQLGLIDMGPDAPRSARPPEEGDEFGEGEGGAEGEGEGGADKGEREREGGGESGGAKGEED